MGFELWPRAVLTSMAGAALCLSGCSFLTYDRKYVDLDCWITADFETQPGEPERLRFGARASGPFQPWDEYYMNVVEVTLQSVTGFGRHLREDAVVEGAHCEEPWKRGKLLPLFGGRRGEIPCVRRACERVHFAVRTKWGRCTVELPAGRRMSRTSIRGTFEPAAVCYRDDGSLECRPP